MAHSRSPAFDLDFQSTEGPTSFGERADRGKVAKTIAVTVGRALRRARTERGLTLREVGLRSGGWFTPTAVAGYERGERNISLRRFCELAVFYGDEPIDLLSEALAEEPRPS